MSTQSQPNVIHLNPRDNTCVAREPMSAGDEISVAGQTVTLTEEIRTGHKIAVEPIATGDPIFKYGQVIGAATQPISVGEWVHVHNVATGKLVQEYAKATDIPAPPPAITDRTFMGYRRSNGGVGTRNYIGLISTVNCSASVCKYIADRFNRDELKKYPNIDGVVAFKHGEGCGMEWAGSNHEMLNRVMAGMANHPNIGAYLIIGLGCEQASIGYLVRSHNLVQIDGTDGPAPPLTLTLQDCGGTAKTVEKGLELLAQLMPAANDVQREEVPASEIVLATECGGSDAYSGITANPAVGYASDLLVAAGATSILGETTEIYGAEHLLTRRSTTPEIADKLLARIDWWHHYIGLFNGAMDNNPSQGNKEGGLTTIAEKSLGAVAKGGTTALVDVYEYAEPVTAKGFVVMDTPGFDAMSLTGMVAGGANVIVFTTGRGSCYGCKPTPSIKIASNSSMYQRMEDDMDIDAGKIMSGSTVQEVGQEIFDEILSVASGHKTKSEEHGIGDEEFVPWTVGPIL
jgi:altronate hydrolase